MTTRITILVVLLFMLWQVAQINDKLDSMWEPSIEEVIDSLWEVI